MSLAKHRDDRNQDDDQGPLLDIERERKPVNKPNHKTGTGVPNLTLLDLIGSNLGFFIHKYFEI
jgi:hypothetical protein